MEPPPKPYHPTNNHLQQMSKIIAARIAEAHHRRHGLEDDEELSRRDLYTEEFLFGREYDDFLVERDAFDDLD